eukprot:14958447-Alexandrium_andersonii.AAC.1
MSASLVGSEMCIRDRTQCGQPSKKQPKCSWVGGSAIPVLCKSRDSSRAVSYTHLTLPTICSV